MPKKRKADDGDDDGGKLFCVCRKPNDRIQPMLECDFCSEWYHSSCLDMEEDEVKAAEESNSWKCPGCIDVMKQNPMLSKQGLLGFQGRVAPKSGWSNNFPVEDIDESVIRLNVDTKRHKREGYSLYKEEKVLNLSCNVAGCYTYFKSQCMPSMKTEKAYAVYICLKDVDTKLKWATCSCPAGIDGQCKHTVAVLYFIIDLSRQGVTIIPEGKTCTSKLQTWHVRKPLSDEPLLFTDIHFLKHDSSLPIKRDLSCTIRSHNPVPDFARTVSKQQIQRMVNIFDINGVTLPVLDTIRSNFHTPVLPKQQIITQLQQELFEIMTISAEFSISKYLEEFTQDQNVLYNSIVGCDIDRTIQIERRTRMQSRNNFWFEQRIHRLTASTFGTFCKLRATTDPIKTYMQKKSCFRSPSVQHGIHNESVALARLLEKHPCLQCPTGLIINPTVPFLGASPDLVIKENGQLKLVEVKCPYSIFQRKQSIKAQLSSTNFYLQMVNGEIQLKRTHDYFYQIQGQLNLTGLDECKLVVFVPPDDMVIVTVKKDKQFFETCMLPKLCSVWFSSLFPYFMQQL